MPSVLSREVGTAYIGCPKQLDAIFERAMPTPGWRRASPAKGKPAPKSSAKVRTKAQPPVRPAKPDQQDAPAAAPPPIPSLPRVNIDISFAAEFDLSLLSAAASTPPEQDGDLHHLRERFAHLGLALGFDELLCLPHLRGIETFWHQVETYAKVESGLDRPDRVAFIAAVPHPAANRPLFQGRCAMRADPILRLQ